jgi:hypothetical protein
MATVSNFPRDPQDEMSERQKQNVSECQSKEHYEM